MSITAVAMVTVVNSNRQIMDSSSTMMFVPLIQWCCVSRYCVHAHAWLPSDNQACATIVILEDSLESSGPIKGYFLSFVLIFSCFSITSNGITSS